MKTKQRVLKVKFVCEELLSQNDKFVVADIYWFLYGLGELFSFQDIKKILNFLISHNDLKLNLIEGGVYVSKK